MKEQWKPIKDYEGIYEVSNFGRVRSVDRICGKMPRGFDRNIKGKLMNPTDNGHGYMVIQLKKNGTRKTAYIHRLVAEAFLKKPEGCNVVDHIDYDTKNNNVNNLQWCTQKENVRRSSWKRRKQNTKYRTSNTGEKYITNRNGRFRVCIRIIKKDKSFSTLEEAISFRNEVLNENSITK